MGLQVKNLEFLFENELTPISISFKKVIELGELFDLES